MQSFISAIFNQTLVLWNTPVNNGYNALTYATPIEIKGRWENKSELLHVGNTELGASTAQVYTMENVKKGNWVYLGSLTDLTEEQKANPKLLEEAYEVKEVQEYTKLRSTAVLYRKVSL